MVRLAFPSLSSASVICVAAQIRMSASQMVAMPYSPGVTFTVTPLTLYSIGVLRGFFAKLKNGRSIVSRWSRIGMSA